MLKAIREPFDYSKVTNVREYVILALQGTPGHMEFFVTGFSLTGNVVKQTER